MNDSKLTKGDIEVLRSIPDLRAWQSKWLQSMPREQVLLTRDRLTKKFFEEIGPALIYLETKYGAESGYKYLPVIGNQSYDGIVLDAPGNMVEHLECTYAKDGQLDYQVRKTQFLGGIVDLHSVPDDYKRGAKWGNSEIPMRADSLASKVDRFSDYIKDCIVKKTTNKSYASGVTLIIAHAGFPASHSGFAMLLEQTKNHLNGISTTFSEIWLVTIVGETAHRIL